MTTSRLLALVLLAPLLAGTVPGAACADAPGTTWPFGAEPGRGLLGRGRDLYNLGILGAKASGQDDPGPAPSVVLPGGRRRVEGRGRPASDDGPSCLVVEILFPGGPAEAAGLEVGDVIVGVGRSPFREAALQPLADALRKAEAGRKKGKLTLLLARRGASGRRKVEVEIPITGKAAAKPTVGEGRRALVDAALAWLATRQVPPGGFPQTLSGLNGAVVMTSLAGLAWLAGGSDLEQGTYRENVERAADFVIENAGETMRLPPGVGPSGSDRVARMRGTDQTNWGLAHATIFLGELHVHSPSPKIGAALRRFGSSLAERQEPSGGWAHGPGGPNPLGYTELNIVTGLALCGLGLAAHSGWEISEGVIEKAETYLRASSGGDGGVGYSDQPGQRGMGNIGRTAGAWLAYRILGRDRADWGRKMGRWVDRHADGVFGGHASLMQHVLLAGVAAHAAGGKAKKRYWAAMERDLVLARAPDGSFQPRPWHESLQMGSNSDVTFGEVWTTAAWAVVLGCDPAGNDRPGLPAWTARQTRRR